MATEFKGQKYGDLLTAVLDGHIAEASTSASDELPQARLSDGRSVTLVVFPDDVLSDEFSLTVIEPLPNGLVATRLYDQKAIDSISALRVGDPGLLAHGIALADLHGPAPDLSVREDNKEKDEGKGGGKEEGGKGGGKEEGDKGGDGKGGDGKGGDGKGGGGKGDEKAAEDNSLQTEREVKMATNPEVIKALSSMFTNPVFGECPKGWQNRQEPITTTLLDGRVVPAMVLVANCTFGNPIQNWLEFPVAEQGLTRRVCSMTIEFESTKEFIFKEVQKSTKITFGYAIGLAGLPGLPLGGISPKVDDQVFKNGEALTQPDGAGGLINVKFNAGFVRQYVKIFIRAHNRLAFKVKEMQCSPRLREEDLL